MSHRPRRSRHSAYWVAHVDVPDPETYQNYSHRAPAALGKYGARILARGGRHETLEGDGAANLHLVIVESLDTGTVSRRRIPLPRIR